MKKETKQIPYYIKLVRAYNKLLVIFGAGRSDTDIKNQPEGGFLTKEEAQKHWDNIKNQGPVEFRKEVRKRRNQPKRNKSNDNED